MPKKDLRALAQNFHQSPPAVDEGDDVDVDAELARRLAAAGDDSPAPAVEPKPKRQSRPKQKKAAPSEPPAAVMKKATVHLPVEQIAELRAWKQQHRRSTADVILSAYLEHGESVRARFGPNEADQRRIALGLAPLATAQQREDGPRSQVGLYIKNTALEELDALAKELSLSRSQLVSELLADAYAADR